MLRLLFCTTVVLALACQAQAQSMFAGYDAFCGIPVVVGPDPQTATARRDGMNRPYIHIDPRAMANWNASRLFVLAHECAHHALGHTTHLGQRHRYMGGTRQQELEADCWAANVLARWGYDGDITRTMVQNASQGHFAGGGYPSGVERARLIARCSGQSGGGDRARRRRRPERRCRTVSVPCEHKAHPGGDRHRCSHVRPAHPFDRVPCRHWCGRGPCHRFDQIPCQHPVQAHPFDVTPCRHAAHPGGHTERICR